MYFFIYLSKQLKRKIKAFNVVLKLGITSRSSSPEFLNLSTIGILDQIILLFVGDCLVYFRMFSSILGTHPLDASITTQVVKIKNTSRFCQTSPEGELPCVKNYYCCKKICTTLFYYSKYVG